VRNNGKADEYFVKAQVSHKKMAARIAVQCGQIQQQMADTIPTFVRRHKVAAPAISDFNLILGMSNMRGSTDERSSQSANGAAARAHLARPPKPAYRFAGELPTALAQLRDEPLWVAWDYCWKGGRWTKPPFNPRTGRYASISDPATWGTFDEALAGMQRHDLAGVGLVLTESGGVRGYDLDSCITDAGSFSDLAAEVIGYAESYTEISPSGEGIRGFVLGKVQKALKDDKLGVELYGNGRFLTVTGRHVPDTPHRIAEAPRTLARLTAVVEAAREAKKQRGNTTNGGARAHAGGFFANVNAAALARLDAWVPVLHPCARKQPNGAWRITSHELGRNLEEDLSYHHNGIKDHGEEYGLTPIDAVLKYGDAADAAAAAMWLCRQMGVEPAAMGWKTEREERAGNETQDRQRSNGRTQAQILIEIATGDDIELFHAEDGTGYADIIVDGHRETWPLKSRGFRQWLCRAYYESTGGAPNSNAMSTAMGMIEARAQFDGEMRPVFLRLAAVGRSIYLDLCDRAWRGIEITEDGWRIIDTPPVRFRRAAGMLPIPEPRRGGRMDELRDFMRVDDDGYVLLVSWLLAVLRGLGPYPILGLNGEQGVGKSVTADLIRRLVDPHTAPLRSLPRDTRELFVTAINGHVLVFDNLSAIPAEVADALCRLSTGGGFSARALFTDTDEVLFDGQRPIAMTSITDVASRSDLADRLIIVRLDTIPDDERQTEAALRAAFEQAAPRLLGALLDVVAHGLMQLPHTRLNRYPRMADYAQWISACETAMWSAGMHLSVYEANRQEAADTVLDADPVAMVLRQYMDNRSEHTTTATELLATLGEHAGEHIRRIRQWPASTK
jgi:hypothetical protein